MNKAMLAQKLSERLNVSRKTAEDFVEGFQMLVTDALIADEEVTIAGFGTFSARIRAGRKGVNPRNPKEVIDVPSVKVPKFKAGKALKDALKGVSRSATATPAPAPVAPVAPVEPPTVAEV
ncbi:MAG: HU family DNA-binding protein [Patescibacteria group bacterium]|jgi:DNA-binding protein HU-beta